jgi:hypothetical protein
MIWDVHTHLHGVEGRTPEEKMTQLLRFADHMGVERFVLMMGYPFTADPSPDELRRQNDQALQAIAPPRPRLRLRLRQRQAPRGQRQGDRPLRPRRPDGRCQTVDRAAGQRRGGRSDRQAGDGAERAHPATHVDENGGQLPGESSPLDLAELAKRHPKASLIAATRRQLGAGAAGDPPFKNVVTETGGSDPTTGFVEMAVRAGVERVLFGSDAGGRSFASQLAKARCRRPEAAKKPSLARTRRLLTPILKAKDQAVTVDTNVHLGRWPFRTHRWEDTAKLVAKRRRQGVTGVGW